MLIIICNGPLRYVHPSDEARRAKHLKLGFSSLYYHMTCDVCGYECNTREPESHQRGVLYTHHVPMDTVLSVVKVEHHKKFLPDEKKV